MIERKARACQQEKFQIEALRLIWSRRKEGTNCFQELVEMLIVDFDVLKNWKIYFHQYAQIENLK